MRARFADTFYYLALLNPEDARHQRVVAISEDVGGPIVTTAWVLTEVADALSAPAQRPNFLRLLSALRDDPDTHALPASQSLFERGIELFARRPDKDWSLTDCISFVVMEEQDIADALTGGHHFQQAGFRLLLR
jgi:predicted nucleic acid-binding protein